MAKTATVQYRQLKTDLDETGANLKDLLVDVLSRTRKEGAPLSESASSRIVDLDDDGTVVVLNKLAPPSTWHHKVFTGQLLHLKSGADVQAVMQSLEENTSEFLVENVELGDQAKVLKGALYFAMVDNHVGLIEGQQVRGRTLERYLTRIFFEAGELENGEEIVLNARFASNGRVLESATELSITARPEGLEKRTVPKDKVAASDTKQGTGVFDVLAAMGWDSQSIESLKKEIPNEGYLEGFFRIKIKGAKRKKVAISRSTIEEALRNIDEADLGLSGEGSQRNGIVKLSKTVVVETVKDNLLVPTSAMTQIVEALKDWSKRGKIDCTF